MKPDIIIAFMHWGNEYQTKPSKNEIELARWMINMGVDHVIGSHPHVIQPVELIGDTLAPQKHFIAYSLGNYISNMSARHTDGGLAVKLVFKKVDGITRLLSYDYSFVWTSRPALSGKLDFILYPEQIGDEYLNGAEKLRMKRYINDAESVLSNGVN